MDTNPPVDLGPTLGVGYVGVGLCAMIYGAATIQTFQYYTSVRFQSDRSILRALVGTLWILGTARQAVLVYTFYSYLIIHNVEGAAALLNDVWAIPTSIVLTGWITLLVDCYLILRIWHMSKRNIYVCAVCGVVAAAHFLAAELFAILELAQVHDGLVELEARYEPLGVASASLDTATNVLIMVALSYYLRKSRGSIQRTKTIVNTLIKYSVTTGALCACFSLASLISYSIVPSAFYNYIFSIIGAELYINVLLTSLNARENMRRGLNDREDRAWDSVRLPSIAFAHSAVSGQRSRGTELDSTVVVNSLTDMNKPADVSGEMYV